MTPPTSRDLDALERATQRMAAAVNALTDDLELPDEPNEKDVAVRSVRQAREGLSALSMAMEDAREALHGAEDWIVGWEALRPACERCGAAMRAVNANELPGDRGVDVEFACLCWMGHRPQIVWRTA